MPACVKINPAAALSTPSLGVLEKNLGKLFENRSDSTLRAQIHTRKRRSSGIISIALHDLRPSTDVTEDRLEKSLHTTLWGLVKKWSKQPQNEGFVKSAETFIFDFRDL